MSTTDPIPAPSRTESLRRWIATHQYVLIVVLCAWVAFFLRNWEGDLHGDPVRYAAVAKTMLTTGEWLTPQDAPGVVYPNKPPLMFWLVAATFRVFGITTWSAKVWSCLFAFGGSILTFLIGRRLFDETVGMLAAAMTAAMSGITINAIDCRLDSAATFFALGVGYQPLLELDDDYRLLHRLPIPPRGGP